MRFSSTGLLALSAVTVSAIAVYNQASNAETRDEVEARALYPGRCANTSICDYKKWINGKWHHYFDPCDVSGSCRNECYAEDIVGGGISCY